MPIWYSVAQMPSDIRAQLLRAFERARDEYIAAIKAHADALAAAITTEAIEVNSAYERASMELTRKQEAYRQATKNLRD